MVHTTLAVLRRDRVALLPPSHLSYISPQLQAASVGAAVPALTGMPTAPKLSKTPVSFHNQALRRIKLNPAK